MRDLHSSNNSIEIEPDRTALNDLISYAVILPILIILGIFGNILHLITLRSRALRSVPFMYIRAIAVFDLFALIFAGLFCAQTSLPSLSGQAPTNYLVAVFFAHLLLPVVNCLLTGSLFTALVLTVERYRLASISQFHQLRAVQFTQRTKAKFYILASFSLSFAFFLPMVFEMRVDCSPIDDHGNCTFKESEHDFWKYYKKHYNWTREALCRMIPVVFLAVLNFVLVMRVHEIRKRRNLLKLRQSNLNELQTARPSINSFTEKRITTMMIGITFIYVIGNIPQAISMILTNESNKNDFNYQIFRSFANIMEIGNHCLNFYIFCLTSQDYLKTFVRRCHRLKAKFKIMLCPGNTRRESVDSQSTTCHTVGEQSFYVNELEDDLVCL